jgi:transposase
MLAELIDAVVGVDTHRDTHEVEIAFPTGTAIGTRKISNDNSGFAELLAWIVDDAPGPRVVVSIEGTRSFGVGLARAVAAAGLTVIECEQPNRKARRGKGESDPIDAHLAVLAALRLDADRLPVPRADGDREALRILLGTRHELTVVNTAQTNRLRALLLGGRIPSVIWPVRRSPIPCSSPWCGGGNHHRPAANRRCGTARSDAWLTPYGRGVTR